MGHGCLMNNAKLNATKNIYLYFLKTHPQQSLTVICAFICAAIAEMLGIGIILPIISTVLSSDNVQDNALSAYVQTIFTALGIPQTLLSMLIFMVLIITGKAIIIFTAMRYVSYTATDISRQFRERLIQTLMSAKWGYYASLPIGKISNMLSNEGQRVGNCYLLAGKTTASVFQLTIYLIAAFLVSWQVSILAIILGGALVLSLKWVIRMARKSGQEMSSSLNTLLARMSDSLMAVKPIRSMGQEGRFLSVLRHDINDIVKAQRKQYISNQMLQVIYEPVMILMMSIGLYVMISHTNMAINEIILLAFIFHRLMNYANLSQNNYQNTIQNENAVREFLQQIDDAQAQAEHIESGARAQNIHLNDKIKVDGITLSYGDNVVLQDFSCDIEAHKINVLFGPSGSGKSSLVDSITAMNQVDSGSIYIDSTELKTVDIKTWRSKIGYVPQETILFHDSIKNNITFGCDEYSDDDVLSALDQCDLIDFVNTLPLGLDNSVGERGTALSGGQRQRIALARALIRKPELIIMDEATTGLDKKSEDVIINTIKALRDDVTIVIISHDDNIRAIADNVIQMSRK